MLGHDYVKRQYFCATQFLMVAFGGGGGGECDFRDLVFRANLFEKYAYKSISGRSGNDPNVGPDLG